MSELFSLTEYAQQWGNAHNASDFVQQCMHKLDGIWQQDFSQDGYQRALSKQDIAGLVDEAVAAAIDEAGFMRELRVLRNRLMLRWIWRDVNQLTPVMVLTEELSYFADAAILAASQFAKHTLQSKYGIAQNSKGDEQQLLVFALGKLGGRELNLSSDIDLVFAYDESGQSSGVNGKNLIDVQQYCILWGQLLIKLLDQNTTDGIVFRVDMRLRPWGDGSPLAISYNALERYLVQHGRDWERYAWIKARAVTANAESEQMLAMTRSFVYRLYVDYTVFDAIREMKRMIEKELVRKDLTDDVKLGQGGIREIEFIIQAFQLIYGGSFKELRVNRALEALDCLVKLQLIDDSLAKALHQAYLFLRRLEHAIQALQDRQTQQIPTDATHKLRIAAAMGYSDWNQLAVTLSEHRLLVRSQFDALVAKRHSSGYEQIDSDQLLAQVQHLLDGERQQKLEMFWQSKLVVRLTQDVRNRLDKFWPLLLQQLLSLYASKQISNVNITFDRLIPLLEHILRRSVYLVLLIENPKALTRLLKMLTASPWIANELTRYPVLLDDFLNGNDYHLPSLDELQALLRQQLLRVEPDDVDGNMRLLRLFKKSAVLDVAASDVLADRPLMKVSDALTAIAEVVLQATLNIALHQLATRYGFPQTKNGAFATLSNPAFAVIAYGKLGGIEMSYGSDLDLVFVHDIDEQEDTNGAKAISGMEFVAKMAQKMMSMLTTQTLDGRAYEIDTRLRPSGHSGMLVVSLSGYAQYLSKDAWVWEHQALARSRGIAGDSDVLSTFESLRKSILCQVRDQTTIGQAVLDMRQKMREHLGCTLHEQKNNIFHLKHDAGGIVDIEFMAQYCVLVWGAQAPALAQYSDNVRVLQAAATVGCISQEEAHTLIAHYLLLRTEIHRLALAQEVIKINASEWLVLRKEVIAVWHRLFGESLNV